MLVVPVEAADMRCTASHAGWQFLLIMFGVSGCLGVSGAPERQHGGQQDPQSILARLRPLYASNSALFPRETNSLAPTRPRNPDGVLRYGRPQSRHEEMPKGGPAGEACPLYNFRQLCGSV